MEDSVLQVYQHEPWLTIDENDLFETYLPNFVRTTTRKRVAECAVVGPSFGRGWSVGGPSSGCAHKKGVVL